MTTMNPLKAFQHELLIRRVASRYVGAMEHATPEAMKKYLKEHPGADKSKHKVKKDMYYHPERPWNEISKEVMGMSPSGVKAEAGKLSGADKERFEKVLDEITGGKEPTDQDRQEALLQVKAEMNYKKVEKERTPKPVLKKKWHADVQEVAFHHDLKDDDADELKDFKKRKPSTGKPLTDQQLMQKFLREASPETKERMKGMNVGDFKKMYAAIMDEEGEG